MYDIENRFKETFFEQLHKAKSLSGFNRNLILERIVSEWASSNPSVKAVFECKTSFEKEVGPVVQATHANIFVWNNTRENQESLEKCREWFKDIMPLTQYEYLMLETVDLTKPMRVSEHFAQEARHLLRSLVAISLFFAGLKFFVNPVNVTLLREATILFFAFAFFSSGYTLFWKLPRQLSRRKKIAENALSQARFLDAVVTTVRSCNCVLQG